MAGQVMMRCGHAANATQHGADGTERPCCAICAGLTPAALEVDDAPPSLEGRTARCYCGRERPSSAGLAFFAHRPGAACDAFYCGCDGWD